jgi:peptidoglycan/xylan/chitin deacetylase (PgdA/CDA1 family)
MIKFLKVHLISLLAAFGLVLFAASMMLQTDAATNIIPNPSVETVSATDSTLPDGWVKEKSGTNTTTFSYLTTGHAGSRSLKVDMTAFTNGDSHFKFNPQSVAPSTKYDFSLYYQSNVATEVDAEVTLSNGSLSYIYIGNLAASTAWKQYTATVTMPANAAKVTVYATIFKVGYLITDDYSLSSQATTPTAATPTFSPAGGTYTSAQTVTISDSITGAKIYYTTDGTAPTTSSSVYSAPLTISSTTTVKAIAMASGYTNSAVASATYTINNSTPIAATPTFSPAAGTYSSAQTVTISDVTTGAKIYYTTNGTTPTTSSAVYSAPLAISSTTTVKAIAAASGYNNSAVASAAYTITLPPAAGNIVLNPSVETVSATDSTLPDGWVKEKSGTNTTTFSYLTTGHTGSRSLKVNTTKYTSGDAHFKFKPQPVTASAEYEFSFYYQSDLDTEIDAEIQLSDGQTSYQYVGYSWPSTTWNKFSATLTMPANAVAATVYVATASKGYVTTDDYSLARTTPPTPLNRAIVTLSYDEMNSNVYTYGYPLFQKYGIKGNLYLLSSELGTAGMMSKDQLFAYRDFGFEIGSHTVTHPNLPQITAAQLTTELKDSQTALSSYFGIPIPAFASPYGEYNDDLVNELKKYYTSHRTTDSGFNSKNNFDPYRIKAFSIESDMTADYVKSLIDRAVKDKTWLVLVYHDIRPDDGSGDLWTTTPANMETVLSYLKTNNVTTLTTSQAVSEIKAQM